MNNIKDKTTKALMKNFNKDILYFFKSFQLHRAKRNVSIEYVADFLNLDKANLAALEKGTRSLSDEQITILASFYGLNDKKVQSFLKG